MPEELFYVPFHADSDGYTYSSDVPMGIYRTYDEAAQRIREVLKQEPVERDSVSRNPYGHIEILGIGDWEF